jgi:hypothetical protein
MASVADGSLRWLERGRHGGAEAKVHVRWRGQRRCPRTAGVAASDSARSDRGARTALSGPAFSRRCKDRWAPPRSANAGATGGDTEADRRVPLATISPI